MDTRGLVLQKVEKLPEKYLERVLGFISLLERGRLNEGN